MYLSLVIPVYNEEQIIARMLSRTGEVLDNISESYEIICVDDCSEDSSINILLDKKEEYPLRVIKLKEHTGQSAALAAGFLHARGEKIAMMDADLQCIPEDLPLLLDRLKPELDAVCGLRLNRQDSPVKKISSKLGNFFRNKITGENIKDINGPLKVFKREAILSIPYFRGFHRFIPTLLKAKGYSVEFVPVNHFPRKYGYSKYNISNRLFKGFFDVLAVRWFKKNVLNLRNNTEEL